MKAGGIGRSRGHFYRKERKVIPEVRKENEVNFLIKFSPFFKESLDRKRFKN